MGVEFSQHGPLGSGVSQFEGKKRANQIKGAKENKREVCKLNFGE